MKLAISEGVHAEKLMQEVTLPAFGYGLAGLRNLLLSRRTESRWVGSGGTERSMRS